MASPPFISNDVRNSLYCWLYRNRLPPKGKTIPLEAKYRHLPITPFHGGLQKVKGKVDGFTELRRGTMIN